jgi:hypothetical protein
MWSEMDIKDQIVLIAKEATIMLIREQYSLLLKKGWVTEEMIEYFKEVFELNGKPTFPNEEFEIDVYEFNDNSGYGVDVRLWIEHLETDFFLQAEAETDVEKTKITRFFLTGVNV